MAMNESMDINENPNLAKEYVCPVCYLCGRVLFAGDQIGVAHGYKVHSKCIPPPALSDVLYPPSIVAIQICEVDWHRIWHHMDTADRVQIHRDEWTTQVIATRSGKPILLRIDPDRCFRSGPPWDGR